MRLLGNSGSRSSNQVAALRAPPTQEVCAAAASIFQALLAVFCSLSRGGSGFSFFQPVASGTQAKKPLCAFKWGKKDFKLETSMNSNEDTIGSLVHSN